MPPKISTRDLIADLPRVFYKPPYIDKNYIRLASWVLLLTGNKKEPSASFVTDVIEETKQTLERTKDLVGLSSQNETMEYLLQTVPRRQLTFVLLTTTDTIDEVFEIFSDLSREKNFTDKEVSRMVAYLNAVSRLPTARYYDHMAFTVMDMAIRNTSNSIGVARTILKALHDIFITEEEDIKDEIQEWRQDIQTQLDEVDIGGYDPAVYTNEILRSFLTIGLAQRISPFRLIALSSAVDFTQRPSVIRRGETALILYCGIYKVILCYLEDMFDVLEKDDFHDLVEDCIKIVIQDTHSQFETYKDHIFEILLDISDNKWFDMTRDRLFVGKDGFKTLSPFEYAVYIGNIVAIEFFQRFYGMRMYAFAWKLAENTPDLKEKIRSLKPVEPSTKKDKKLPRDRSPSPPRDRLSSPPPSADRSTKKGRLSRGKSPYRSPSIGKSSPIKKPSDDKPTIAYTNGDKVWYQDDKLHRDNDLPAVIYAKGDQKWYQHGKLHRENDLPAVIAADGTQEWYRYGEHHRSNDLPAIIAADGKQVWYDRGELHRENDLPAVIEADGTQKWYYNNELHRDGDKPAVITKTDAEWWTKGVFIRKEKLGKTKKTPAAARRPVKSIPFSKFKNLTITDGEIEGVTIVKKCPTRWILGKVLHDKAKSTVYKATTKGDSRKYVLKKLPVNYTQFGRQYTQKLHKFVKEVYYNVKLSKFDIAPDVFEWGVCEEEPSYFYMVSANVGKTLEEYTKEHGFSKTLVESITRTIISMCKRGVFHDDLHTGNFMVDNGDVRIIDFGKAKDVDKSEWVKYAGISWFTLLADEFQFDPDWEVSSVQQALVITERISQKLTKSIYKTWPKLKPETPAAEDKPTRVVNGRQEWLLDGQLHRDNDLPAIVHVDGGQEWWQHGERHRDNDLPAVVGTRGYKAWYQHGQPHRENDLPAIIAVDGTQWWYQHGERHRDGDLPAVIKADETRVWYQNGQRHRENDLPAIVYANGKQEWYRNSELHRDNGLPAVVKGNKAEWWVNGKLIRKEKITNVKAARKR